MQYFKFSEFETSGEKIPNQDIQYNIESLVNNVLDKVRAYYGKPIYILEGYNPNSSHNGHATGIAADITTKNKNGNVDIFEYIKTLEFDELSIIGDYEGIHISSYPTNRGKVISNSTSNNNFLSQYIVCLDSGHGKDVAGKCSPDKSLLEWQWAREIKYRVAESLESQKIALCFDINPEDTEPGLTVRANRANAVYTKNNGKTIFVSIHVNAAGNGTDWLNARGWEIYTTKGLTRSDELATDIWNECNKIFTPKGLTMRKDMSDGDVDKEANFTVIYKTLCPSVLVENFFMDNKDDLKYLLSEEGKSDIVEGISNGIKVYLAKQK